MILRCSKYGKAFYLESQSPFIYSTDFFLSLFLQLATRVAFHDHLLPVCLPPADMKELPAGTNCTVIGWGKKEDKNCKFAPFKSMPQEASSSYEKLFCLFALTGIQFPFEFFPFSALSLSLCLLFRICFLFSRQETPENVDEQTHICVNVCRGFEGSKHFSTPSHVCFRNEDDTGDVLL